ncbi:hypothetical protein DYQ86_24025 [Acidobacteria bacterium AB60]|nr:hypothetical protein DYQ86_24025 [Acidobacteria bacterium AB60]
MFFQSNRRALGFTAAALLPVMALPSTLIAQEADHLVNPATLQDAAAAHSTTRQTEMDTLNRFFSNDRAARALQASHMDPQQVKSSIATLNDQELAQLASRASKAEVEFAAGTLSDRDLLVILVAIAALILIIVAVR